MGLATKLVKSDSVIGFNFTEIPLDEAVNAVIAGDGNYADIKAKLLEALPSLPAGKAFAFGLPNGKEVEEDRRRGICMAMNATLKKAKQPWRVTYAGVKKLFVCVPRSTARTYQKRETNEGLTGIKYNTSDAIELLWKQGRSPAEIAKELGEPLSRVQYVCYKKYPHQRRSNIKVSGMSPDEFVEKARKLIGYDGPFINGRSHKECMRFRAAASLVGTLDFHFSGNALDKALGFKNGGSNWYANRPEKASKTDVEMLRQLLKVRG